MERNIFGGLAALLAMSAFTVAAQAGSGTPAPPDYIAYDTRRSRGTNAGANGINNLGWASGTSTVASGAPHADALESGQRHRSGHARRHEQRGLWPVKNNHGLIVGVSETDVVDPLNEQGFSCGAFLDLPTGTRACRSSGTTASSIRCPCSVATTASRPASTTQAWPSGGRRLRSMT